MNIDIEIKKRPQISTGCVVVLESNSMPRLFLGIASTSNIKSLIRTTDLPQASFSSDNTDTVINTRKQLLENLNYNNYDEKYKRITIDDNDSIGECISYKLNRPKPIEKFYAINLSNFHMYDSVGNTADDVVKKVLANELQGYTIVDVFTSSETTLTLKK